MDDEQRKSLNATHVSERQPVAMNDIAPPAGRRGWIVAVVIAATTGLTYRGALSVPLFSDDIPANAWPVVRWSLAMTTAHHAVNIALHVLSALLLFGIVRRTLLAPGLRARFAAAGDLLAGAVALLWALHPLQSEAVVRVAQRAELLAGGFYLLAFYAYLRGTAADSTWRWNALAMGAGALGMASKETMVTAPLLVFLHDAMFVAGGWREAWRARWRLHAGLAATWVLFAFVVMQLGGGHGGGESVAWWAYALKQSEALAQYLRLSVWPAPLVMDYGSEVVTALAQVRWQIVAFLGLAGMALFALRRRKLAGFAGAWFFLILAPSSSVVALDPTMAEPRMYLPLAAMIALVVVAGYEMTGRRSLGLWLALPMVFVAATRARVADYESELRIWGDTALKRPFNVRAHVQLGDALRAADKLPEAITQYEVALRLKSTQADTLIALAEALLAAGRSDEAIGCATEAVRLAPVSAEAHYTLGRVFAQAGRRERAVVECETALRLDAGHAGAKALLERLRKPG